jgi:hypothetical protein
MSNIALKLKHEFLKIIPATVFFFIAFQLLALTNALILEQYGIQVSTFVNASIAALIVAKVVLIVDLLPFVNRFPHKPLIYNIIWKTLIYIFAALIVRYIEHLLPFIHLYDSLSLAHQHLLETIVWSHFWVIQIWLLVYFLMFCTLRELIRVLGSEKIKALFIGTSESK